MRAAGGPVRQFWLMDERAMDPDQFNDAILYAQADTVEEARKAQHEAGCGIIVEIDTTGPYASWVRLVTEGDL